MCVEQKTTMMQQEHTSEGKNNAEKPTVANCICGTRANLTYGPELTWKTFLPPHLLPVARSKPSTCQSQ